MTTSDKTFRAIVHASYACDHPKHVQSFCNSGWQIDDIFEANNARLAWNLAYRSARWSKGDGASETKITLGMI